jgi:hypothetical protein
LCGVTSNQSSQAFQGVKQSRRDGIEQCFDFRNLISGYSGYSGYAGTHFAVTFCSFYRCCHLIMFFCFAMDAILWLNHEYLFIVGSFFYLFLSLFDYFLCFVSFFVSELVWFPAGGNPFQELPAHLTLVATLPRRENTVTVWFALPGHG